jgi:hypothetical protein
MATTRAFPIPSPRDSEPGTIVIDLEKKNLDVDETYSGNDYKICSVYFFFRAM